MESVTITIEFELTADSSWLIDSTKNEHLLNDLASRAAREFKRDLAKMNSFSTWGDLSVKLVNASAE